MKKVGTVLTAAVGLTLSWAANAQDAELMARAQEYLNSCASCHGIDGRGAGFLTRVFRGVDPGDLTQLAKNNGGEFPFLEVFQVIDGRTQVAAHGDREMPVWGDRYKVQMDDRYGAFGSEPMVRARVLELVYFIQWLQEREEE